MEEDAPLWANALANLMAFGVPSLFLAMGIWMLVKTRRFMSNANRVSTTVVDIEEQRSHENDAVHIEYLPTYEYRSIKGEMVRARAFRTTRARPEVGDQKIMLVNPDEPEVVRYSSLAGYGFAAFGIGIGAPALISVILYH